MEGNQSPALQDLGKHLVHGGSQGTFAAPTPPPSHVRRCQVPSSNIFLLLTPSLSLHLKKFLSRLPWSLLEFTWGFPPMETPQLLLNHLRAESQQNRSETSHRCRSRNAAALGVGGSCGLAGRTPRRDSRRSGCIRLNLEGAPDHLLRLLPLVRARLGASQWRLHCGTGAEGPKPRRPARARFCVCVCVCVFPEYEKNSSGKGGDLFTLPEEPLRGCCPADVRGG